MCLAVPARLVECEHAAERGIADLHGNRVQVCTTLVPEVRSGDWVLIHAGFVIQKLDGDEVRETWAVLDDLREKGAAP